MKSAKNEYSDIIREIRLLIEGTRNQIARKINIELLQTYWAVGRLIVKKEKAEKYDEGSLRQLFVGLSKELTIRLGKGFSRSNLFAMRNFHLRFTLPPTVQTVSGQPKRKGKSTVQTVSGQPKKKEKFTVQTVSGQSKRKGKSAVQTVSGQNKIPAEAPALVASYQLSWSHYNELLKCNSDVETGFYLQTAILENWSVRELRRQMDTALFERIALSKNAKGLQKLGRKRNLIETQTDLARDPYVLDFLQIPVHRNYNEKQLEQKIINNLQSFILELGKGFAFIGRQYRISLDNKQFYVDLVFYHVILKCYVLMDLKVKAVKHQDIGQMNLYLNYFAVEKNEKTDNPPIGIILSKYKGDITVEYALRGISNKIFVSKYQLYLPDKKLLQRKVEEFLGHK